MFRLTILFFLILFVKSRSPKVRALWNFYDVAKCVLHYDPLIYLTYGCWCGPGGAHSPEDAIDECCRVHDLCYDSAVKNGTCKDMKKPYVESYYWHCEKGNPICSDDNDQCQSVLCACDAAASKCWGQFPKPRTRKKCKKNSIP